jgi:hypothetical protein
VNAHEIRASIKAANDAAQLLDETTSSGYSVRGECWHARALALFGQHNCAAWVAERERKAARRNDATLAPWGRTAPCKLT